MLLAFKDEVLKLEKKLGRPKDKPTVERSVITNQLDQIEQIWNERIQNPFDRKDLDKKTKDNWVDEMKNNAT